MALHKEVLQRAALQKPTLGFINHRNYELLLHFHIISIF